MTLSIGISLDPNTPSWLALARQSELLGVGSVWVAEYWAYDAFTPLAAIAAVTDRIRLGTGIVQLGARTPAMLAMSALSLQRISDGRLLLGIGASGPQVMEGWHGVEFHRPLRRTRETIDILRMVSAGERLAYQGSEYQVPVPGSRGKPIRSRAEHVPIPIYIAALGPANLALTGELGDGWLGNSFFPASARTFFEPIEAAATTHGRQFSELDMVVAAGIEITTDDEVLMDAAARRHADGYAFTFGAMGTASKNFYADAFSRQGYGEAVAEVQRLWAAGDRAAAAAAVPTEIGRGTNLIGPPSIIKERLREYRDCGVTTLRLGLGTGDLQSKLATLEVVVGLVDEVNSEASRAVTPNQDGDS